MFFIVFYEGFVLLPQVQLAQGAALFGTGPSSNEDSSILFPSGFNCKLII